MPGAPQKHVLEVITCRPCCPISLAISFVAVAVAYIALFGIAVETAVVMMVYLRAALDQRLTQGRTMTDEDIEAATIDGAVLRLRPVLMTVFAVIASLAPLLWETGVGSDVMKPIAAPIVGGMISSTIAVMILVPIMFTMLKERALRQGVLNRTQALPLTAT
jgi:copper/silver efflux system protein